MKNNTKKNKTARRINNKKKSKGKNSKEKKKPVNKLFELYSSLNDRDIIFTDKYDAYGYPISSYWIEYEKVFENAAEKGSSLESIIAVTMVIENVGAKKGCIQCMKQKLKSFDDVNKPVAKYPILLEMCIRGHPFALHGITEFVPENLKNYWFKILEKTFPEDHECKQKIQDMRRNLKKLIQNRCFACYRKEGINDYSGYNCDICTDVEVKLKTCTGCKFYSFCSEECQKHSLKHDFHINHCKQQQILEKYHKPYAKMIQDKIKNGDDPKTIPELQVLREKLGLTRPKDDFFVKRYGIEYGDWDPSDKTFLGLDDECDFGDKTYPWVARKNGMVPVGFVTEAI